MRVFRIVSSAAPAQATFLVFFGIKAYLNTLFKAIIVANITHALPASFEFLVVQQVGRINAFLKRKQKYGFCLRTIFILTFS